MKRYIGTKIINATPMNRGEYNRYRGWPIPADEDPTDKGYLVQYSDGYESWSPEKQFNEAYRECDSMTFGLAVEALKKGLKVARKGWNGKGMHLFLAHGEDLTSCLFKENEPKCVDSICMKTAQDTIVVGWLASQTDILSEDWMVVE